MCQAIFDTSTYYAYGPIEITISGLCDSAISFDSTAFSSTAQVSLEPTGVATLQVFASGSDYASTTDTTNCPIESYELLNADETAYTAGVHALDTSTGELTVGVSDLSSGSVKIKVCSSSSNGNCYTSPALSYEGVCGDGSTTFSAPATMPDS